MKSAQTGEPNLTTLARDIKAWATALGFQQAGITDTDLSVHESNLRRWLEAGFQGEMDYLSRHGSRRSRPAELVPGTVRVISVRMNYMPAESADSEAVLADDRLGFVSRYALGRDYHKVVRNRLQALADQIRQEIGEFGYRVFSDSAPVLEKALAEKSGLGWIGKHTNLLNRDSGSWFFLGEIYTDLPLPVDSPATNHCGTCQACITACPTAAIVGPYQLDARRCISYLTIELQGSIPVALRPLVGNRIYGCDDCQLVCPWNRFSRLTVEKDFAVRHGLDAASLVELISWNEEMFLQRTEGSAIRRIGHERWLRNVAVALGNSRPTPDSHAALRKHLRHPSEMVVEHVQWALDRLDQEP